MPILNYDLMLFAVKTINQNQPDELCMTEWSTFVNGRDSINSESAFARRRDQELSYNQTKNILFTIIHTLIVKERRQVIGIE